MVKSDYRTDKLYSDKGTQYMNIGPDTKPLLTHSWKLQCSPKWKLFVWQIISDCLPVYRNLHSRGIKCYMQCQMCGAEEESINHVFFECALALQIWVLSNILSCPRIFPTPSFF